MWNEKIEKAVNIIKDEIETNGNWHSRKYPTTSLSTQ
jgi:hypothetical protein